MSCIGFLITGMLLSGKLLENCKKDAVDTLITIPLKSNYRIRQEVRDMRRTGSQDGDAIQCVCMFCGRHKNDAGGWDNGSSAEYSSIPASQKSHGLCPDCLKEHYPAVHVSLCKDGKVDE